MARSLIIGLFLFAWVAAAPARALESPIYPVHVEITVDRTELNAVVRMNAVYLSNEILFGTFSKPLSGTHWPQEPTERARAYVENCLTLKLDGHVLSAASFSPRFIQEPLGIKEPRFVFTLRYPIVNAAGRLSGRIAFFSEAQPVRTPDAHDEFVTYLSVIGKNTVHFELPLDKPDFELSLDGMERPIWARWVDQSRLLLLKIMSSSFFWIVLIFAVVQLIQRWKRKESST
jgi:hypothetical protein